MVLLFQRPGPKENPSLSAFARRNFGVTRPPSFKTDQAKTLAMKNNNLEKLIKKDDYQVFVLCCPANLPFVFAVHPWIVCNEKGCVSRWEVLFRSNKDKTWGHLHLNHFSSFSGIEILPFFERWVWGSKLLKVVEGDAAKMMIDFVKLSRDNYPHKNYSLTKKNSNTYVQWVLNNFPEIKLKLPWNAFGRNGK